MRRTTVFGSADTNLRRTHCVSERSVVVNVLMSARERNRHAEHSHCI
jgi:hypothetical protein